MSIKIIDASAEETRHRGTGGRGVKTIGTVTNPSGEEILETTQSEQIPNSAQAHASLATTSTASTLATLGYTAHANTKKLQVQAVSGEVRMTVNGTDPTATLGFRLSDGDIAELGATEIGTAKFITASGTPKLEIGAYLS